MSRTFAWAETNVEYNKRASREDARGLTGGLADNSQEIQMAE
jgi:hypothetical protein